MDFWPESPASGVEKWISGFFRASGNQKSTFLHPRTAPPSGRVPCPLFLRPERPLQSKYEGGGLWFGTEKRIRNTAGNFTPGAIEGSHVVATKQYSTVPCYNTDTLKRGGLQLAAATATRTKREGPQQRDPQGGTGSSEGAQRGDGRRPGRRPFRGRRQAFAKSHVTEMLKQGPVQLHSGPFLLWKFSKHLTWELFLDFFLQHLYLKFVRKLCQVLFQFLNGLPSTFKALRARRFEFASPTTSVYTGIFGLKRGWWRSSRAPPQPGACL